MSSTGPGRYRVQGRYSKVLSGKEHGQGEVCARLETNKDKVSAACKSARDKATAWGKARLSRSRGWRFLAQSVVGEEATAGLFVGSQAAS